MGLCRQLKVGDPWAAPRSGAAQVFCSQSTAGSHNGAPQIQRVLRGRLPAPCSHSLATWEQAAGKQEAQGCGEAPQAAAVALHPASPVVPLWRGYKGRAGRER